MYAHRAVHLMPGKEFIVPKLHTCCPNGFFSAVYKCPCVQDGEVFLYIYVWVNLIVHTEFAGYFFPL